MVSVIIPGESEEEKHHHKEEDEKAAEGKRFWDILWVKMLSVIGDDELMKVWSVLSTS